MIGDDRDLIGDAEVKLYKVFIEIKPAKHNTRAQKKLVSAGTHAARPLRVVESEFRPEDTPKVVLQGHVGEECRADDVLIGGRDSGQPIVPWKSKSPQPMPPEIVGVIIQAGLLVKAVMPVGAWKPRNAVRM